MSISAGHLVFDLREDEFHDVSGVMAESNEDELPPFSGGRDFW